MVCQCPFELAVIDAAEGQWRQRMDAEPADVESFQRRWRLHGALAAGTVSPWAPLALGWPPSGPGGARATRSGLGRRR